MSVTDMVVEGDWYMKDPQLQSVWPLIQSQAIPDTLADISDTQSWTLSKTGMFSFNSAWELARESSALFQVSNMVWFNNDSPKMALCLLRAIYNKLLTMDFLLNLELCNLMYAYFATQQVKVGTTSSSLVHSLHICGPCASLSQASQVYILVVQKKRQLNCKEDSERKGQVIYWLNQSQQQQSGIYGKERNARVFQQQVAQNLGIQELV